MAKTKKPTQADSDSDSDLPPETTSLSFEGALDQLEQTVAQLEEGEMPLEAALELFESGVKLSRQCGVTLEAAEKRIEILVADRAATSATEPFDDDGSLNGVADVADLGGLADEDDAFEDDFDEDG